MEGESEAGSRRGGGGDGARTAPPPPRRRSARAVLHNAHAEAGVLELARHLRRRERRVDGRYAGAGVHVGGGAEVAEPSQGAKRAIDKHVGNERTLTMTKSPPAACPAPFTLTGPPVPQTSAMLVGSKCKKKRRAGREPETGPRQTRDSGTGGPVG